MIWIFGGGRKIEEDSGPMKGSREMIQEMKGTAKEFNYPHWLFYVVLGLVLLYLVYRLYRSYGDEDDEGYTEERESIFTLEDLKHDLNSLWNKVKSPFLGHRGTDIYDGSTNILIIREIYYNFLHYCSGFGVKHRSETPNKYLNFLLVKHSFEEKEGYLKGLTDLYNKARYKKKVDEQDVDKAREAWDKLKSKEKEEEEE
jgi:hypothetical protein